MSALLKQVGCQCPNCFIPIPKYITITKQLSEVINSTLHEVDNKIHTCTHTVSNHTITTMHYYTGMYKMHYINKTINNY